MSVKAKIYQPAKHAMQSGMAKDAWVFEYEPVTPQTPEPLMGWNSGDTLGQVKVSFPTRDEAIAFAKKKGVTFELLAPKQRRLAPRPYAANFAFHRQLTF